MNEAYWTHSSQLHERERKRWGDKDMKKILVVDDKSVFHVLYVEELRKEVHPVFARSEFERLVKVVDEHNPDLVLIDIRAANHRGLDIMKAVSKACHDLPFRLYTSSCRDEIKSILCHERSVFRTISTAELKVNEG